MCDDSLNGKVLDVLRACPVVSGYGWGECLICRYDFIPTDPGLLLACQHVFHLACLEDMLIASGKCCICRSVYVEVSTDEESDAADDAAEDEYFGDLFSSFPSEFTRIPDDNNEELTTLAEQIFVYAECQALTRDDDGAFVMVYNAPAVSRHACFPGWNPLTMPTLHAYNPIPVSQYGIRVASIPASHTALVAESSRVCQFFVDISRPISGKIFYSCGPTTGPLARAWRADRTKVCAWRAR